MAAPRGTSHGMELLGRPGVQNVGKQREAGDDPRRVARAFRLGQRGGIRGEERQDAEILRVIRHHQEVQRAAQARWLAARRPHGFAFRETIGVVGRDPRSQREGRRRRDKSAGAYRPSRRCPGMRRRHWANTTRPPRRGTARGREATPPLRHYRIFAVGRGCRSSLLRTRVRTPPAQPDERLALDCCSMPRQVRAPLGICSVTNRRRSAVNVLTSPSGSNISPIRTS